MTCFMTGMVTAYCSADLSIGATRSPQTATGGNLFKNKMDGNGKAWKAIKRNPGPSMNLTSRHRTAGILSTPSKKIRANRCQVLK